MDSGKNVIILREYSERGESMNQYEHLANSVVYSIRGSKAALIHKDSSLNLVGEGRSAFAFRIKGTNLVLKVFFPQFEKVAAEEAEIYKELAGNPFFPLSMNRDSII